MNSLLQIGLTNALLAAMLATLVFGITRRWPSAHLAHALWLIVLVKLLVPPLVPLRLYLPAPVALGQVDGESPKQTSVPSSSSVLARRAPIPPERQPWSGGRDERRWDDSPMVPSGTMGQPDRLNLPPSTNGRQRHFIGSLSSFLPLTTAITIVWLAGSVAWILLAGSRIIRFHRQLKDTELAPENIQREARTCALRMGLADCPPIRLVEGSVPPMVWSAWRPIVLLPAELIGQLDEAQRHALVAHELAHIRRRDHWVRWLEMVVLAVYWWNPCAWWARRKLQAAEEQCCDGWVVWLFPRESRAYASALLKTVEYLSQDGRPAPVLASGFGHVPMVKRRLEMIVNKQIRPRMSSAMRLAVILAGLLVLPAAAQVAPEENARGEPAASETSLDRGAAADPEASPDSELAIVTADAEPTEAPATASAAAEDQLAEALSRLATSATDSTGEVLETRISRLEKMIQELARIVETQNRRRDVWGSTSTDDVGPAPRSARAGRPPSPPRAATPPRPPRRPRPSISFGEARSNFERQRRAVEQREADVQLRRAQSELRRHQHEIMNADNELQRALHELHNRQHQIKLDIARTELEMEKMQVELKFLHRQLEDIEAEKQELEKRHREMSDAPAPRPDRRSTPRSRR